LREFDFDCLLLWGHYRLVIDLHLRIKDKITDINLRMGNLNGLGFSHHQIGKVKECIEFYQQGMNTAREVKDSDWESVFLANLGLAYAVLGEIQKAIKLQEQSVIIAREIGNRKGESASLGSLGSAYKALGNLNKAIDYHEQALIIKREIGDRRGEGIHLGNLGNRYKELGDDRKAIEYYEQALVIFREIGNRSSVSINLDNTGLALLSLEDYQKAKDFFQEAIYIADELPYPLIQNYSREGLSQVYLFQNDLVNARATIEAALQYDVPMNNHNASALHGIIALRQGERETAQGAFMKSIAQADEILAKTPEYYSALDAKGLALCGRVVSGEWKVGSERERDEIIAEAVKTFKRAREIAPHAGVVKSVLRLFDELVKCDEEGVLKDVRKAVEGG